MPPVIQSSDPVVRVEVGGVTALLTLNRPHAYNALDLDMAGELARTLTRLSSDEAIRSLVITGAGPAFSGGGDLRWAAGHARGQAAAFHELASVVNTCVIEIRRMRKPVIAAVNGAAAGGGFSLALAADFRVMAANAVLRQGYTSNGLCIDAGGTFTLPRMVGLARALEIAAFDEPIDALRAEAWGLATRVVPADMLLDAAMTMARHLSSRSVNAFGRVKALMTDAFDRSLESQLEDERRGIVECAAHADGIEGVTAFLEKRAPEFLPRPE
jgi:2-(1,2-epoxy-1,2-dihydrophenyl)acetyl-CoA isomerase